MEKHCIGNERFIRIKDLKKAIAELRVNIDENYKNFEPHMRPMIHLAYNDIMKAVYKEELENAHTPEEIRAIHNLDRWTTESEEE